MSSSTSRKKSATKNARERLKTSVLEELWSIWRTDPRVPSVGSRRSWAISRNAIPRLVDNWFLRRKACAKKAGRPILDDPYDLPLGRPGPPIAPKREQSATPIKLEFDAFPDLPSDDTLVYPVDFSNDLDASSDTAFYEDTLMESKRPETPAYNEVPQKIHPEHRQYFQPEPSSANFDALNNCYDKDPLFENIPSPVCNQGQGEQSSFTCVLCSSESQGTPDMAQPDSRTTFDSRQDPFFSYPRLDFSSTTLSELSAVPFLFRTPPAVPPDSAVSCQNVNDWTIVEEELSRLVHDGELDFSFLDVPHLSSMELID